MKNVYKQKREQGFTIIEVLIVLAIAALIFLIVFLAVPALNRNSRNNAVKHDAANILTAVQTYESNNNGTLPTNVACASGTATVSGTGQSNTIGVQGSSVCTFTQSFITNSAANIGHLNIATGQACNAAQTGYSQNARSTAVSFLVETGASTQATQCVDS